MKIFLPNLRRFVPFLKPYKNKFFLAIFFTFLFTIFNGVTFSAVIPVIDTMTPQGKSFSFKISDQEKEILKIYQQKSFEYNLDVSFFESGIDAIYGFFQSRVVAYKIAFNNWYSTKTKKDQLIIISFGIIPLFFFRSVFSVASVYLMRRVGLFTVKDIRSHLFAHLQKLSLEFFYGEKTGHLMQRLTQDMSHLSDVISKQLEQVFRHILTIAIFMAAIFYISWEMSLFALIVLPIMIAPIAGFTNSLHKASKSLLNKASDLTAYLQEALSGVRVIRSFGRESFENDRFGSFAHISAVTELKKHLYAALSPSLVEFFSAAASSLLLFYGGLKIISGEISTGEFIFFLLALLSLLTPIKQLSRMSAIFIQADAVAERSFDILDRRPKIVQPDNPKMLDKIQHGLEFKKVCFRYERSEEDVLKEIDILVPKGQTVALVGPSGGGKSTIMDMCARFYDPLRGEVTLDTYNLRELDLIWFRSNIAIVTQEIFLFSGSLFFNISYGKNDATMEQVIAASKAANAHEFISQLPNGYHTQIGERGINLSGGQRQRVAIARAILCDPEILLLDEATSALDTESEKLVQEALNHLLQGRTSLVIAHRLSTILGSDNIYVIENGRVSESGSHTELLALQGSYKRLYDLQFES